MIFNVRIVRKNILMELLDPLSYFIKSISFNRSIWTVIICYMSSSCSISRLITWEDIQSISVYLSLHPRFQLLRNINWLDNWRFLHPHMNFNNWIGSSEIKIVFLKTIPKIALRGTPLTDVSGNLKNESNLRWLQITK